MNENETGMAAALTGAALAAGTPAPGFTLKTDPNASISLADLRGAPAIISCIVGFLLSRMRSGFECSRRRASSSSSSACFSK